MRRSQSLTAQLPAWARLTHPVLRAVLMREQRRRSRAGRVLAVVVGGGMLAGLLFIGVDAYRRDLSLGVSSQGESVVFSTLYVLLLFLQLFAQLGALLLASSLLASERRREAWELVKVTSHGAEMAVLARWAAVFFQLRWILAALLVPRLFFAGQLLANLTAFDGRRLDLAILGSTPSISAEVAVTLLAALLTAGLVQPLAAVALNAAVGLALAAVVEGARAFQVARGMVIALELLGFGVALSAGWIVLNGDPWTPSYAALSMGERWNSLLLFAVGGDQSLRFMNLDTTLRAWADIDYGALLGAALLAIALVELLLAQGLVRWASYRAARPARG